MKYYFTLYFRNIFLIIFHTDILENIIQKYFEDSGKLFQNNTLLNTSS